MSVKKTFNIGREKGQVGGAFKVQMRPVRQSMARERALAALAGTADENRRKRTKQVSGIGCLVMMIDRILLVKRSTRV